jgi:hypothetical protein
MTMLFPLFFTPYALLHDVLLVCPILLLLSINHQGDKRLLLLAIGIYVAMLVLPLLGFAIKVALVGVIPILLFILIVQRTVILFRAASKKITA